MRLKQMATKVADEFGGIVFRWAIIGVVVGVAGTAFVLSRFEYFSSSTVARVRNRRWLWI
jgi:hypothetical protein